MPEPIPAGLIEAVESRAGDRALAELPAILDALSEHYAGTLIDPTTWERVTVKPKGVLYRNWWGQEVWTGEAPSEFDDLQLFTLTREDPT